MPRTRPELNIGSNFLIGANVPWKNYGWDFADYVEGKNDGFYKNDEWWSKTLWEMKGAGAKLARFWVFGDGSCWTHRGSVKLEGSEITNFGRLLEIARQVDILIMHYHREKRYKGLLSDDWQVDNFINNVVKPLVNTFKFHKEILAWEVINEPEWIFDNGTDIEQLDETKVLRFVGKVAKAIHNEDPTALVTVGGANLKYNCNHGYGWLRWSDDKLRSAVGDYSDNPILDLLQVHMYAHREDSNRNLQWNGWIGNDSQDPFLISAADGGFCNKPVLIGECQGSIKDPYNYTPKELAKTATAKGYKGLLFWAFSDDEKFDTRLGTKWDFKDALNPYSNSRNALISTNPISKS